MGALAIFLMIIGLFNLFAPRAAWFASIGWKFHNAEPSDAYLIMHRIGGSVACIVAIIIIIAGTGHTGTSNMREQTIRADLTSSQIKSVTLQSQPVSSFNASELISWIRDSTWNTPDIDYSKQNSFFSDAELEMHFDNGQEIEVFKMGNGQFGIGEKVFYPEYVFSSPSLENWFSAQGYR